MLNTGGREGVRTTSMRGRGHSDAALSGHDSLYEHTEPHQAQRYFLARVTHSEQSGWSRCEPRMSHLYSVTGSEPT